MLLIRLVFLVMIARLRYGVGVGGGVRFFVTRYFMDPYCCFLPKFFYYIPGRNLPTVSNCYPILRRHWKENPNYWRNYNRTENELIEIESLVRFHRKNNYFFELIFRHSFFFLISEYVLYHPVYYEAIFHNTFPYSSLYQSFYKYDINRYLTIEYHFLLRIISFLSSSFIFVLIKILFSRRYSSCIYCFNYSDYKKKLDLIYYGMRSRLRPNFPWIRSMYNHRYISYCYMGLLLSTLFEDSSFIFSLFHYCYSNKDVLFENDDITLYLSRISLAFLANHNQFSHLRNKNIKHFIKHQKSFKWKSSPLLLLHQCRWSYYNNFSLFEFFLKSKIKSRIWKRIYYDFFFFIFFSLYKILILL